MKNAYVVAIKHNTIFAGGLKAGEVFRDEDEPGKVFVNLTNAGVFEFPNTTEMTFWLLKNIDQYMPKVRAWLLQHELQKYPQTQYPVRKVTGPIFYGHFEVQS